MLIDVVQMVCIQVKETKEVRAIKKRLQTYRNLFRKMGEWFVVGLNRVNFSFAWPFRYLWLRVRACVEDVDGGGGVDFDELKDFCLRMFGETNDELLRMMFKDADEDGSGEIELDEFVHILKKVRFVNQCVGQVTSIFA